MMTSATNCQSSTSPSRSVCQGCPSAAAELENRGIAGGHCSPTIGARQVDVGRRGFMKIEPFDRLLPPTSRKQSLHNIVEGIVDTMHQPLSEKQHEGKKKR